MPESWVFERRCDVKRFTRGAGNLHILACWRTSPAAAAAPAKMEIRVLVLISFTASSAIFR
jgi:hypothetical protein